MRIVIIFLLSLMVAGAARAERVLDLRQAELARLMKALRAAPNEAAAGMLEGRIRSLWTQEASPVVAMLMARGERNMAGDAGEAVQDFDAMLALDPDFAEGYNHRAAARAAVGDYPGAISDIEETLRRDPQHFPALQGLSRIAELQGNWRGALEAWRRALDIDPLTPGGLDRLEKLQKKVEGEAT